MKTRAIEGLLGELLVKSIRCDRSSCGSVDQWRRGSFEKLRFSCDDLLDFKIKILSPRYLAAHSVHKDTLLWILTSDFKTLSSILNVTQILSGKLQVIFDVVLSLIIVTVHPHCHVSVFCSFVYEADWSNFALSSLVSLLNVNDVLGWKRIMFRAAGLVY